MFRLNWRRFIQGLLVGGAILIVFCFFYLRPSVSVSSKKFILANPGGNDLVCRRWGAPPAKYTNSPVEGYTGNNINFYRDPEGPGGTGEQVRYRCDYQQALAAAGGKTENLKCEDSTPGLLAKDYQTLGCSNTDPEHACYTPGIAGFIDNNYYGGGCQVIQIDLTNCNTQAIGDYPAWDGGTAFVIAYNDECVPLTPTLTASPTPTVFATPTITITPTSTPTPTGEITSPSPTFTPSVTEGLGASPTPTLPEQTPTPIPTGELTPTSPSKNYCYIECGSDSDCGSTFKCQNVSGVKRCVNIDCSSESDCTCNRGCWNICGHPSECDGGQDCRQIGNLKRCVLNSSNSTCNTETECCPRTTPQVLGDQKLPSTGLESFSGSSLVVLGLIGAFLRLLVLVI